MHRVDVYNTQGVLKYQLTDYAWLNYRKHLNSAGLLQFGYAGDSDLVAHIEDKWQFEVWNYLEGNWVRDFVGVFRGLLWEYSDKPKATILCRGLNDILSYAITAYPATTSNRTAFYNQPCETIAKTLVQYNLTPGHAGRDVNIPNEYPFSGVLVEADSGAGKKVDWFCTRNNLLTVLQDLARVSGYDFELVKVSDTEWEFRWFEAQLTDVLFAMERGNMGHPQYAESRSEEKTVGIVGGAGEGVDRDVVVVSNATPGNHIEVFVNASHINSKEEGTAGLYDKGDEVLEELRVKKAFSFDVLQTGSSRYGVHYNVGDLVTAINPLTGDELQLKVTSADVSYSSSGVRNIQIELS